jgi:antitoxin ParD1/3/4
MAISLTPQDKKLIQKHMKSGSFKSVEEVIHDALAAQDSEAEWLIENKVAINGKIARGISQLDRGEGVSGDIARARMKGFVLSPEAEEDIFEIWSYLANEVTVEFADQIETGIFDAFALLSKGPGLGPKRQDPLLFYRAYPYPYLNIYRRKTASEASDVSPLDVEKCLSKFGGNSSCFTSVESKRLSLESAV